MGKRILFATLIGLTLAIATQAYAEAPRLFAVDSRAVAEDRYPQRVADWPGGVSSLADVTYSNIPGYRPLIMDIYMPPKGDRPAPKPLVLYVHGGGWVGTPAI